jgi:hypothetical protein
VLILVADMSIIHCGSERQERVGNPVVWDRTLRAAACFTFRSE